MDFSLKKSFKSHGSYKQYKQISRMRDSSCTSPEKLPILLHHDHRRLHNFNDDHHGDRQTITVDPPRVRSSGSSSESKNNGDDADKNSKIQRESSYQFWEDKETTERNNRINVNDQSVLNQNSGRRSGSFDFAQRGGAPAVAAADDPPARLIGQFLQKQTREKKHNNGEIALDMDLEMDELSHAPPPVREPRVSFDVRVSGSNLAGSGSGSSASSSFPSSLPRNLDQGDDQVVRCTSNASFQRKSELISRVKTRSRLQDPNPDEEQMLSGWIGKSGPIKTLDDEEDDPLADEDVPEEYRRAKFNALTLIQWLILILIIAALICSLVIHSLKDSTLWNLQIWKWEVFLLILICGRLVSGWGIRVIVFFIERNFLLRKRVLYFVYGLRKAVQNCLWLGLVLLAWHFLLDKKVRQDTKTKFLPYMTKILICFLVGTILWLIKTLMVKVLASSFHVSTYFDRIQESVFNQYVIETLSGPPIIEINRTGEEEDRTREEISKLQNAGANLPPDLCAAAFPPGRSGRVIGSNTKLSPAISIKTPENGITIDHLHKLNHKNISAWNMKRLMKIVRKVSLSTLDEQMLDNPYEDESARQIRSENEAKAAARKIFKNVAQHGSKYIYLEDLMRFLREDEAVKTMSLFEGALESKRIGKSVLKNWLVNAFRERRALALTLNDTKTAVNMLHQIVNILAATVIVVIWLVILEIATSKFLLFVSSQLVLLAFMFGNTCKTVFESIIFLFFIHPYDVGDRCEIDGEQMVVEEMNILTTVFLRFDNLKILYPNSVLWQKPISNYYRSPDMGDAVEFCVHIATPAEKIAAIKQRISSYIDSKPEYWYPSTKIIVKDMEDLNRVRLAIWPCHRINHQDMGERFTRRALLIEEIVKILKELDLQFRLLPLDINVRTMPPVVSSRVPTGWTQSPT